MRGLTAALVIGCILYLMSPTAIWAQATAQISGTVRDANGAVLPGVQLTATQTGISYAWYDNSLNNKFDPNPNATVYYGDQTWEEMHFPSYGLVLADPTTDPRKVIRSPFPQRPGN